MTDHNEIMTESIRELIAIGTSVGAHCQPCLEYHIKAAVELGVSEAEIRAAIAIGHTVEKGALSAMKKFSSQIAEELLSAAGKAEKPLGGAALEKGSSETVLKIYDPAMCCSSGLCGPSVDPVLA
jgi:AhpD family alkylhydroperoxidase